MGAKLGLSVQQVNTIWATTSAKTALLTQPHVQIILVLLTLVRILSQKFLLRILASVIQHPTSRLWASVLTVQLTAQLALD